LGQILGAARDWDVFTQQTMPAALHGDCPGALRDAAQTRRQDALNHMITTLLAPETTRLILRLMAWVQNEALIPDPSMRHRKLAKLAPDLLSRLEHRVARRGRHIAKLSGKDLHAVRKSLKKLRYSVDDVAGLFPAKAVKRYRKHCTHLQEQLGTINDAAMAITLGKSLQASDIIHWARKRRGKATDKLPDQWAAFRHAHPFWA
jgi:triphosphatase